MQERKACLRVAISLSVSKVPYSSTESLNEVSEMKLRSEEMQLSRVTLPQCREIVKRADGSMEQIYLPLSPALSQTIGSVQDFSSSSGAEVKNQISLWEPLLSQIKLVVDIVDKVSQV